MVCIYCHGNLAVINSRPQKSRNQVWRRRRCEGCGAVFTAVEAIDLSQAIIVTSSPSDGAKSNKASLQPFERDRLFISLYKSLQHRPTALHDARSLADTVTAHIIKHVRNGSVDRLIIKNEALNTLQRFDKAAASHYAAFHP